MPTAAQPSGEVGALSCVAVIPARYGSTRFPGKPLALLAGRPMIAHVIERCRGIEGPEEIVVATDDQRIADAAQTAGARAVETPGDLASGTDRVAHVAATLDADLVLNIQGDEPLFDAQAVGRALGSFAASEHDYGTLRAPLVAAADLWDPNVVKVVVDHNGRALYFSRAALPFPRNVWRASRPLACDQGEEGGGGAVVEFDGAPALPGPYWLHVGIYMYRRNALLRWATIPPSSLERSERLEQLRVLEAGEEIQTYEVPEVAPGVDTPADLERVRKLIEDDDAV